MRCACVDIGTNTTRLLVAERSGDGLREIVSVRRFARLKPAPNGEIPAEAIARIAELVTAHVAMAREHGATNVRTVATAAIRHASNGGELCDAVQRAAGVAVDILSGQEEAGLAFQGALATFDEAPEGVIGVIDVGGGSSELVTGTAGDGVGWFASLPVGSGVLTDRHVRSDPPSLEELAAIRADIETTLNGVAPPAARLVLAVGGSATSLAGAAGGELAPETIARVLSVLIAEPRAQAARRLGLHGERTKLLPAGLLVLEAAWEAFGRPPLHVVRGGLREGVILRALAEGS
jgi:exopolyphosphatase/guanosine-5'-triphosphate,3'-diphosphate pyrophosphatase